MSKLIFFCSPNHFDCSTIPTKISPKMPFLHRKFIGVPFSYVSFICALKSAYSIMLMFTHIAYRFTNTTTIFFVCFGDIAIGLDTVEIVVHQSQFDIFERPLIHARHMHVERIAWIEKIIVFCSQILLNTSIFIESNIFGIFLNIHYLFVYTNGNDLSLLLVNL